MSERTLADLLKQYGRPEAVDVAGTPFQDQQSALAKFLMGPKTGPDVRDPQTMGNDPFVFNGGGTARKTSDLMWDDALSTPTQRKVGEVLGGETGSRAMMLANFLGPAVKLPKPVFAPPDMTRTGWTFKDVGHPNKIMQKGDWRAYNNAVDNKSWMDVELPIRSMTATQQTVNPDFMNPVSSGDPRLPPMVMKKDGQYFVHDGHHRLTRAAVEGKQTAPVRLIDLDGTTQTDFPLLDALAKANGATKGIRAYHGSPHDFEKFDLAKIGSGEGAQAYGHGLYFAENEAVAKSYKNAGPSAAQQYDVINGQLRLLSREMDKYRGGSYGKYTDPKGYELRAEYDRLLESKSKIGKTYEVSIKADPSDFLDWDAPLSKQSEKVRAGFTGVLPDDPVVNAWKTNGVLDNANIGSLYKGLAGMTNRDIADGKVAGFSNQLRESGIPGIKYKDAGSRGAGPDGGTNNFVVFDDSLIEILRKYGLLPLVPGTIAATQGGSGGNTNDY